MIDGASCQGISRCGSQAFAEQFISRTTLYPLEINTKVRMAKKKKKNKKTKHLCEKNTKMLIVCSTILFPPRKKKKNVCTKTPKNSSAYALLASGADREKN